MVFNDLALTVVQNQEVNGRSRASFKHTHTHTVVKLKSQASKPQAEAQLTTSGFMDKFY